MCNLNILVNLKIYKSMDHSFNHKKVGQNIEKTQTPKAKCSFSQGFLLAIKVFVRSPCNGSALCLI